MRRWVLVAAALLAVGLALWTLRERAPATAPDAEEIDDASKQALREILKQERRRRRELGAAGSRGVRAGGARAPRALGGEERRLARPAAPRARARLPHALRARPRSHRALARLPAARVQDAGLRLPRGRPLPEPAHAHARGQPDRAHAGARAPRSTRTSRRRSCWRTTSATRPSATRASTCSTSCWPATAASTTTARRCASWTGSRSAIRPSAG